jgi:hypothetical protein
MTPTLKEPAPRRLTADSILPGVQVGLLLLVVPLVGWVSSLQLAPLQLAIDGVQDDVSDLRQEFRKVDQRIDDLAARGPNETVMALIAGIQQRLDRLEKP